MNFLHQEIHVSVFGKMRERVAHAEHRRGLAGEVRAKRQQVVGHDLHGQTFREPVEFGQQLRRTVDGDHARAGARQRDGVHAEARAEIDHQRARG